MQDEDSEHKPAQHRDLLVMHAGNTLAVRVPFATFLCQAEVICMLKCMTAAAQAKLGQHLDSKDLDCS